MKSLLIVTLLCLISSAATAKTSWDSVTEQDPFTEKFGHYVRGYTEITAAGPIRIISGCLLVKGVPRRAASIHFEERFSYTKGPATLRYRVTGGEPRQVQVSSSGDQVVLIHLIDYLAFVEDLQKGKGIVMRVETSSAVTANFTISAKDAIQHIKRVTESCDQLLKP